MVNDNTNVTQKILSDDAFDVSDGERHAKTTADDIGRGIPTNDYKNKKNQVYSKTEELERGVDDELDALKNLLNRFENTKQSESFQKDFENGRGFVDAEHFQLADDIIDIFRDIVPRLTLIKELLYNLSDQQDSMIDIQKLAHDESRIKDYIEEQAERDKERYERMFEIFETEVSRYHDRLEELREETNSLKKTEAKKNDELNETLQQLTKVIASNQQQGMQPQYNPAQGQPYPQQQNQQPVQGQRSQVNGGNGQVQPQTQNLQTPQQQPGQKSGKQMPDLDEFDLNDKEEELVETYYRMKDQPDFTQAKLAEELEYSDSTISSKLQEMEDRGLIPPRQG